MDLAESSEEIGATVVIRKSVVIVGNYSSFHVVKSRLKKDLDVGRPQFGYMFVYEFSSMILLEIRDVSLFFKHLHVKN
jgi:hypothetical protein